MVTFRDIPVGKKFVYDGDTFIKSYEVFAWELRNGRKHKEWTFNPDDRCRVVKERHGK